jgi:hypothetical protein
MMIDDVETHAAELDALPDTLGTQRRAIAGIATTTTVAARRD